MTNISTTACKTQDTAYILRKVLPLCLILLLAGSFCGCSPAKKSSPIPKTRGQLLLEIYDAVEKKQYATALQKIERYRVLDPGSAIMAEMEQTVRFNRLTAVVDFYLKRNNFRGALNAVLNYEKEYGISKRTMEAKEHLQFFARLDQAMEDVSNARNAHSLEQALKELEKIRKERRFSQKTVNFLRKEQSKLKRLRQYEKDLTGEMLCMESALQAKVDNNLRTAEVLFALVKALYPDHASLPALERYFTLERIYPD